MKLNEEQTTAVRHKDGPMLVLAGPGSGKTAVITARTMYLIEQYHIAPSSILVVTFTRAAAGEMRERFLSACNGQYRQVTFGTFHSFFYAILRHAYGIGSANIIREDMRCAILRDLIIASHIEVEDEKELIELLTKEISQVKTEEIDPEHFYASSCPADSFRFIYRGYHAELRKRRLFDFDDLMTRTYELFSERPDILGKWQERFSYLLIDEFQDINRIQYKIMKMLAGRRQNIFVVGDDDQSIYRFRGAKPEIMFAFVKDFADAKQVTLRYNYRCPASVVQCAGRLIAHNKKRFDKKILANNPLGNPVEIRPFSTDRDEISHLLQKILEMKKEGKRYQDIAVLFRTNAQSRRLLSGLMAYNIPFIANQETMNLFEHWIAKQVIAYLRLAGGERNRNDFLMIMNKPNRYIHRDSLARSRFTFEELYIYYEDKDWMCERIEELEADLKMMGRMTPFAAINYLRLKVGYDRYLKEYSLERHIKADDLYSILDEI